MGKKGRGSKGNTPAVKNVEPELTIEEPVPETPKEPELSIGEKRRIKQMEKEEREEKERVERLEQLAQKQKQESKTRAKKNKPKSQKIKLDRNYSESSQQSSPEKVVQSKQEETLPREQIGNLSLQEELPDYTESVQNTQNVSEKLPSADTSFSSNTAKMADNWADESPDLEMQQSKSNSDPYYTDNRYQNRGNRGSGNSRQWTSTYSNSNRSHPSKDGSTSSFRQDRKNDSRGGDYNKSSDSNQRGGRQYDRSDNYKNNHDNQRGGRTYRNDSSDYKRRNDNFGDNQRRGRGFSNSMHYQHKEGYNARDNKPQDNVWHNKDNRYQSEPNYSKPPPINAWENPQNNQDDWGNQKTEEIKINPLEVDDWNNPPQESTAQSNFTEQASNCDTIQANYNLVPNYDTTTQYEYKQVQGGVYMETETIQQPEELPLSHSKPEQNFAETNQEYSWADANQTHDPHWHAGQSQPNASDGDQGYQADYPALAKPQHNQSDDEKITSTSNATESHSRYPSKSYETSNYPSRHSTEQRRSTSARSDSRDRKRKTDSFNSNADSSYHRGGYGGNSSYNKRDSNNRFSDRGGNNWYSNSKFRDEERYDTEFKEFSRLCNRNKPIEYGKLSEESGDLFDAPAEYSLAHCVAEDMSMGAGIAKTFRLKFGRIPHLLNQSARTGGLAVLDDGARFLYYLVTKDRSQGKPTMYTLWMSLKKMKEHCEKHGVGKIAIPQIGCGLDRLVWSEVKQMLDYVFKDLNIEIVVYTLDGEVEDRRVRKGYINHQKLSLVNIMKGTGHIYFGYSDGTVTDDITSLSEKFNFLTAYKSNRKEVGDVIRAENKTDVVYGLIIKQSPTDQLDFVKFERGLRQLCKLLKKDEYNYVGFQAFVDKSDEVIINKIANLMQYNLKDVEIWVCWPKEIEEFCPSQRE